MKNLFNYAAVLVALILPATVSAFSPKPSPNPWQDDYSHCSAMKDWKQWGSYNVHDPSCRKVGDTYYMYSTDAIFRENRKEAEKNGVPLGFIQMRSSKDLVNWDFMGWVFPEIPAEAVEWVRLLQSEFTSCPWGRRKGFSLAKGWCSWNPKQLKK